MLVVNGNRERRPQTLVPIGACAVAAAAEAAGHETHFLDLCFARWPLRALRARLRRVQPEVIGLSVRNLDNCDAAAPVSYLPEVRALVQACRQQPGAVIVLGGAAVSLAPAAMLRTVGGDYAVVGEGERTFVAVLRALVQQADPAALPGVVAASAGIPETPAPLEMHLDTLPAVDYTRWLALSRYRACDAAYPLQTKRGCCFRCSYCRYAHLEGRDWRLREPAAVVEEAARAAATGLRLIEVVDSVFGLPTAHAIACCEAMHRRRLATALCTVDLHPTACVPELMQAMHAAGFTSVAVTAESGSEAMLAQMQKGFTVAELHRAAQTLRGLPAQKMWIFLVGAPGECEATLRETARFIGTLPATDFVYVNFGVRVLPGTALQQALIASGELDTELDLLPPYFYHSPQITPARAQEILAQSGFPAMRFVTMHDSAHWVLPLIQRLIAKTGLQPPYWRHLPGLNRLKQVLRL